MKLTSKLIISFLLISLLSSGILIAFNRFATNREFNRFINTQYRSDLTSALATYYEENKSWLGVDEAVSHSNQLPPGPNGSRRPPFYSIADPAGKIIVAGFGHRLGDLANHEEFANGTPIIVNDEIVGRLLLETEPDRDPIQDEFLQRVNDSILLSAIGTIILSLILGAIISRTITRPIRELTSATHEMAGGKFGQQVPVRSSDEIGDLASSFNKMNNDLASSLNLRKQMTADIAHELRTPLSLIIGHAEAVHDGVLPPSKENFEIIREEAERLEQLVNDLRTLSLADAGELSMDFQPVDINKLLNDIQSHYAIQFTQKHITLELTPAPGNPFAELDPIRFSQVVTNILDNALRYTPQNGLVSISTSQKDNIIEIAIQDSGTGVTPQEAAHLFDRFYRADSSRSRDEGGSGLGLAIAKSIMEMHKGKLWAESEKGFGLHVYLQLPSLD